MSRVGRPKGTGSPWYEHSAPVIAFCAEAPRTIRQVEQRFGRRGRFTVHNLVKRGELVNLTKEPHKTGLYAVVDRKPSLSFDTSALAQALRPRSALVSADAAQPDQEAT